RVGHLDGAEIALLRHLDAETAAGNAGNDGAVLVEHGAVGIRGHPEDGATEIIDLAAAVDVDAVDAALDGDAGIVDISPAAHVYAGGGAGSEQNGAVVYQRARAAIDVNPRQARRQAHNRAVVGDRSAVHQ